MTDTNTFANLGLAPAFIEALAARDITVPMPVQAAAIPPGCAGRDLLVQSCTGSGKTLAFGLPLLQRLTQERYPQALILAPTRELAQQVATELRKLRSVDIALLVGGLGYGPQLKSLQKGAPVIVGTPGRVKDHLDRETLRLDRMSMVVLDECDEMLNMGFLEDVEEILAKATGPRQTYLFSATLPSPIARLAERFMTDPVRIALTGTGTQTSHSDIAHTPVSVPDALQVKALVNLLLHDEPSAALIFTKTKIQSEEVAEELTASGLAAAFLHGDLAQATRGRILDQFKRGHLRYLVATDVAARGLDISGLPLVVHVGIPTQLENYVHRSGRTGRAGAKGTSLALVNSKEGRILTAWSRRGGLQLLWRGVPELKEIREARISRLEQRIREGASEECRAHIRQLSSKMDLETLAAGLLSLVDNGDTNGFEISIPPPVSEKPFYAKGGKPKPAAAHERPKKPWEKREPRSAPTSKPPRPWEKRDAVGGGKGKPNKAGSTFIPKGGKPDPSKKK